MNTARDQYTDPELRRLVDELVAFADIETNVRAAMLLDGSAARKDTLVKSALRRLVPLARQLANDAEGRSSCKQVRKHLRWYLRGMTRGKNISAALELLRDAVQNARQLVDKRASDLGIVVPPLQVLAPSLTESTRQEVERRARESLECAGGTTRRDRTDSTR